MALSDGLLVFLRSHDSIEELCVKNLVELQTGLNTHTARGLLVLQYFMGYFICPC